METHNGEQRQRIPGLNACLHFGKLDPGNTRQSSPPCNPRLAPSRMIYYTRIENRAIGGVSQQFDMHQQSFYLYMTGKGHWLLSVDCLQSPRWTYFNRGKAAASSVGLVNEHRYNRGSAFCLGDAFWSTALFNPKFVGFRYFLFCYSFHCLPSALDCP